MKALAKHLGEPENEWEIAGLLHDADAEKTPDNLQGVTVGDWYAGKLSIEQRHAMAAHNEMSGVIPESKMDWALFSSEKLTGLIVATALILPSKKLADVTPEMVLRRFKEKSFAKGAKRENIAECRRLNLNLEEFVKICLPAMQEISTELVL